MTLLFLAGYALAAAPNPCASKDGQGCTQVAVGSFDDISRLSKETAGEVDVLKKRVAHDEKRIDILTCSQAVDEILRGDDPFVGVKDNPKTKDVDEYHTFIGAFVKKCDALGVDMAKAYTKAEAPADNKPRQAVEIEKIIVPDADTSHKEGSGGTKVVNNTIIVGPGYDGDAEPGLYLALGAGGFASYRNGDFAAAEQGELSSNVVTTATGGAGGSVEIGIGHLGERTRINVGLMGYGGGVLGNGYEVGGNVVLGTQLGKVHAARVDVLMGIAHEDLMSAAYTYPEIGARFVLEPVKYAELAFTGRARSDYAGHWGLMGGVEARVRFGL